MSTPYTQKGMSMSLAEEYEGDKNKLDRYIEGTPDNVGRYKKVASVIGKEPGHLTDDKDTKDNTAGTEEFDIDEAVLNFPEDENVAGMEDFVEFAKKAIVRLMRMIKNAAIFIYELVFNKISRIKHIARKAEYQLRTQSLIPTLVPYPKGTRKIFIGPALQTNANWTLKSIQQVQLFYTRLMKAHGNLLDAAKSGNWRNNPNFIFETAATFANEICQNHHSDYSETQVLPGGKIYRVNYSKGSGKNRPGVSLSQKLSVQLNDKSFKPDRAIADDLMTALQGFADKIGNDHRSQTSTSRKMEAAIRDLERYYIDPEAKRHAAAYFTWLIDFQRTVLSTGLQYVFGTLFGYAEFISANVK